MTTGGLRWALQRAEEIELTARAKKEPSARFLV